MKIREKAGQLLVGSYHRPALLDTPAWNQLMMSLFSAGVTHLLLDHLMCLSVCVCV